MSSHGLTSPRSKDGIDDNQQPAEASGVGRSWVQSMFSRDTASRSSSFSRVRKWTSEGGSDADVWCLYHYGLYMIYSPLHHGLFVFSHK